MALRPVSTDPAQAVKERIAARKSGQKIISQNGRDFIDDGVQSSNTNATKNTSLTNQPRSVTQQDVNIASQGGIVQSGVSSRDLQKAVNEQIKSTWTPEERKNYDARVANAPAQIAKQNEISRVSGIIERQEAAKKANINFVTDPESDTRDADVAKFKTEIAQKLTDTGMAEQERIQKKGEENIGKNASMFQSMIGVDAKGKIDTNNKDSFISRTQKIFDDYKSTVNANLKDYSDSRQNQTLGQLRATLRAKGIDTNTIQPEQLLALSGEIGVQAFNDIAQKNIQARDAIQAQSALTNDKINELQKQGALTIQEARTARQTLKAQTEAKKQELQSNFANTLFGIEAESKTRADKRAETKTDMINKISQQLGLLPQDYGIMLQFLGNKDTSIQAVQQNIMRELQDNPNGGLSQAIRRAQKERERLARISASRSKEDTTTSYSTAIAQINSIFDPAERDAALAAIEPYGDKIPTWVITKALRGAITRTQVADTQKARTEQGLGEVVQERIAQKRGARTTQ